MITLPRILTLACTLSLLSACGGGSNDDGVIINPPNPNPPPIGGTNGLSQQCTNLYNGIGGFKASIGKVINTPSQLAKPDKGNYFLEPDFATCLVRATNAQAEGLSNYAANRSYQAFNADNTRFIVQSGDGNWYLYNAFTLQRIKTLNALKGNTTPFWDPSQTNSLFYLPDGGGTKLNRLVINETADADTSTVVSDFSGKLPWTNATRVLTGKPSSNSQMWCMKAQDQASKDIGVFLWDTQNQRVVGSRSLTNAGVVFTSTSPSGRWCIVQDINISEGGITAWNQTFQQSIELPSYQLSSYDIGTGINGDDVFISSERIGVNNTASLFTYNIDTKQKTQLLNLGAYDLPNTNHIIRAGGTDVPGWFLLSTYQTSPAPAESYNERIVAIKMQSNPTVVNLAHHRNNISLPPILAISSTITPSRKFNRVLFNSNWQDANGQQDVYMIELPDGWTNGL